MFDKKEYLFRLLELYLLQTHTIQLHIGTLNIHNIYLPVLNFITIMNKICTRKLFHDHQVKITNSLLKTFKQESSFLELLSTGPGISSSSTQSHRLIAGPQRS